MNNLEHANHDADMCYWHVPILVLSPYMAKL